MIRRNKVTFGYTSPGDHGEDCIHHAENSNNDAGFNETDIYDNVCINATDDGLELDGADVNLRVWGNTVYGQNLGTSLAAVGVGPAYIFRNVYYAPQQAWTTCVGIKTGENSTGWAFVYHNTFHLDCSGSYGWVNSGNDRTAENQVFRNNIMKVTGRALTANISSSGEWFLDSDYNFFDDVDGGIFGKLDGVQYNSLALLQAGVSGKWAALEANSIAGEAAFVDSTNATLANRNYRLASGNVGIDSAVVIPGFNDANSGWPFMGGAPDMGAYEDGSAAPAPSPAPTPTPTPTSTTAPTPTPTPAPTTTLPVVDLAIEGDEWRYFKGTSEPAADWRAAGMDDSLWDIGLSGFGYGDGDDTTLLDDMRRNYVSVYARRSFEIVDPTAIASMTLSMNYDDGFIAYINGVEVARSNAPTAPTFDSQATASHEARAVESFVVASPASLLQPGTNVLAVHGFNFGMTRSDFTMTPMLSAEVGETGTAPAPGTIVPLAIEGDAWRYFKGTGEPVANWNAVGADDSTWEAGLSGLGYGDGDDTTILSDMLGGYTSLYVRRTFDVADPAAVTRLTLGMNYDDGFVVYINGVEVARANAPTALTFDSVATATHEARGVEGFDVNSPGSLL